MSDKDNIKKFEQDKNKTANSSPKQNSKILLGFIIVVICISFVYFITAVGDLQQLVSGKKDGDVDAPAVVSESFPVSFTSNDIITAESFSSRIFVLTQKMLTSVKTNGTVDFTKTFTFVEPEMSVSEKYGIVYDRGSSKYILFNSKGIVFEGTTDGSRHIITAAVDNKGNCAVVTKSEDSACRVYLINRRGETLYIWSCAEEYVVSVDISSDSKEILCGSLGAFNGDIITKLYKLNIESSEKDKSFTLEGSACVDVCFYGKDKAIVTCLDKRAVIDMRAKDGAPVQAEFSSDAIYVDTDFNGYTAVLTDKINSFDSDELTVYDKNNSVIYKSDLSENIVDIRIKGKRVYCLTDESVVILNSKGEPAKTIPCDVKGEGIVICSKDAYYYTIGSLRKGF